MNLMDRTDEGLICVIDFRSGRVKYIPGQAEWDETIPPIGLDHHREESMKMDHGPKAYTMQKVGIALVGNATGWSLMNVQPYASLAVTIITGVWILVQLVKFIVTWVREEKQRKKNEGQ